MSDEPLEAVKPGTWDKLWDFLGTANLNSATGILKWIVILVLGAIGLMLAGRPFLEAVTKALEAYKNSGLPLTLRRERRAQIRQRQQFCKVLNGDLLTLAKAESWNDQYFTDLEAEVEAEGGYYPTIVHKMFGRRSNGLRRVPALISAIESSAEQALLLVGQPGSGKSVALRHLGHQFAERGIRSANPKTKIPLYVNLKELGTVFTGGINADAIKQFVLDNIRRGDADTAAYVKQHWDVYRAEGTWFFLFDSFDEIPAVLHAPTGSTVIREYAEAIRQFFEGMSNCRGVLASREFKGPNELPWQKIRILPLSDERQEQLIDNSFLETKQKLIVSQHLASSTSSLRDNPLFLTLLCRYVKDHNAPPINDHDLLSGHIDRLAWRDEDYTKRRYGLAPDQLIEGAIQIATLFAERSTLSLAPTQTEIASELHDTPVPGGNLERLLGALVDVKVGRSDVQEARAGDRRFAFSHRRYQETLFVRHLATKRDYMSPRDLLTNTKWREYAVALLQTQKLEVIAPILTEATTLLDEYALRTTKVPILQELGGHLAYFDWSSDPAVPLLAILQEGLAHRLGDVPAMLPTAIEQLLTPRWQDGDAYDETMVLRYGGLLPQLVLQEYLGYAVNEGGKDMEDIAFQRVVFLRDIPVKLASWVRKRLSTEALASRRQVDILRLEALSARLPLSVGTTFILQRCQLINKLRRPFQTIIIPLVYFYWPKKYMRFSPPVLFLELIVTPALFFYAALLIFIFMKRAEAPYDALHAFRYFLSRQVYFLAPLAFSYFTVAALIITLYTQRSVGCRLNVPYLWRRIGVGWKSLWKMGIAKVIGTALLMLLFITLTFFGPGAVALGIAWILGYRDLGWQSIIIISSAAFVATMTAWTIGVFVFRNYKNRRFLTHLQALKDQGLGPSLVLQAQSVEELQYWLGNDYDVVGNDVATIRSLLRLLRFPPRYQANDTTSSSQLLKLNVSESSMLRPVNLLLKILKAVTELPAKGGDIQKD